MKVRKALSLVLAFLMVLTLIPTAGITAIALPNEGDVAQIGETYYTSLAEAIAAVPTDGTETTIQMIGNETLATNATLTIAANQNVVLDLNGYTVTGQSNENAFYFITNNGTFEITDTSDNEDGKITASTSNPDTGYSKETVTIYNLGGTLTLTKGTVENATGSGLAYAINNSSNAWGSTVISTFNMTGGTVTAPNGDAALRVYQNTGANWKVYSTNHVNISGGTILDTGIFVDTNLYTKDQDITNYASNDIDAGSVIDTQINISGGVINGLIDLKIRHPFSTTLNITGGTFTNSKLWVRKVAAEYGKNTSAGTLAEPTDPIVHISGGDFAFVSGKAFGLSYDCGASSWTSYTMPYEVTGGTFTETPVAFVPAGFTVSYDDDINRYYIGSPYVAQIGNVKYASLAAALEAAQDDDTVTLLKDVNTSDVVFISKSITLDGNGNRLITTANRAIRINQSDVTVTIKDLEIVGGSGTERSVQVDSNKDNVALTIDNVTATATYYTVNVCSDVDDLVLTVNDCHLTGYGVINLWGNNGTVSITNSTLVGINNASYNADGWNDFSVIILEGDTTGQTDLHATAYDVTVTNCDISASSTKGNTQYALLHNNPSCYNSLALDNCRITLGANGEFFCEDAVESVTKIRNTYLTGTTTVPSLPAGYAYAPAADNYKVITKAVARIGATYYDTLAAAIAAVPTDGTETTITMLKDEAVTAGVTIAAGKNIVLELNGKTISGNTDSTTSYAVITNRGTLTIQDSTDISHNGTGTGKITSLITTPDQGDCPGYASNTITNNGVLTIESGLIESRTVDGWAAYTVDNQTNGGLYTPVFTMNGGRLYNTYTDAVRMFLNSDSKLNKVVINGGVLDSDKASGRVVVVQDANSKNNKGELDITGGTINGKISAWSGTSNYQFTDAQYAAIVFNISGGRIGELDFSEYMTNETLRASALQVTGGTYDVDPSIYVSEGYEAVQIGNLWYVLPIKAQEAEPAITVVKSTETEMAATIDDGIFTTAADADAPVEVNLTGDIQVVFNEEAAKELANDGFLTLSVEDVSTEQNEQANVKVYEILFKDENGDAVFTAEDQTNDQAEVTITVPYEAPANATVVQVYYISGATRERVASNYDAVNHTVTFTVPHFSEYSIESYGPDDVAAVNGVGYTTLTAAINAAVQASQTNSSQVTVTLLKNASGAGLALYASTATTANIVIDFGGYTYTVTDPVGSSNTVNQALHFEAGTSNAVTLRNGSIVMTDDATKLAAFEMVMQNYCNLIIDGMTIDGTGIAVATYGSNYGAVWGNTAKPQFNYNNAGTSVIRNSTITVVGDMGIDDNASVTIEDDAKITANKIVTKGTDARYASATPTIAVENGAKFKLTEGAAEFNALLNADSQGFGTVDGEGFTVVESKTFVAQVGSDKFETLAEAVAAATAGQTVTLLADVALTSTINITKSLTIDLNGHNITATDARALWIKSGEVAITGNGTISAVKTPSSSFSKDSSVIRVGNSGTDKAKLTIGSGVTVSTDHCYGVTVFGTNTNGVELVVNGTVAVTGLNGAISGNGNTGNKGAVTINAGAVVSSTVDAAIYHPQNDALVINGGTITGPAAVYVKSGTVTINGGTLTATADAADYSYNGNGCNATGDALVVDNCGYPGGAPTVEISGGSFTATDPDASGIGSYAGGTVTELADVTATSNTIEIPSDEKWVANGSGGYDLVKRVYVTVTFNANGGTNDPESQTIEQGATATNPGTSSKDGNYTFDGWFAPGASSAFDFSTPITADITLTAHFTYVAQQPTQADPDHDNYVDLKYVNMQDTLWVNVALIVNDYYQNDAQYVDPTTGKIRLNYMGIDELINLNDFETYDTSECTIALATDGYYAFKNGTSTYTVRIRVCLDQMDQAFAISLYRGENETDRVTLYENRGQSSILLGSTENDGASLYTLENDEYVATTNDLLQIVAASDSEYKATAQALLAVGASLH